MVLQGPCCYFDCEHKGKRCRRKLIEEFKADVKRRVGRAQRLLETVVWEDAQDEESSVGFVAEPEGEEEE